MVFMDKQLLKLLFLVAWSPGKALEDQVPVWIDVMVEIGAQDYRKD